MIVSINQTGDEQSALAIDNSVVLLGRAINSHNSLAFNPQRVTYGAICIE
jgi:hypothetical protein